MAIDGRHAPALYARFLSSLLDKHNSRGWCSSSSAEKYSSAHREIYQPPQTFVGVWPDIHPELTGSNQIPASGFYNNDFDMDFSLSHFVRTVTAQEFPITQAPEIMPRWNEDTMTSDETLAWGTWKP